MIKFINKYIIKYIEKYRMIFIILILFISFRSLWENIFHKWLFEPILSKFSPNIITTIIFFLFAFFAWCMIIIKYKKRYIVSNQLTGLSILGLCIFIFYRITTSTLPLYYGIKVYSYSKWISYIDFLAIIFIYYISLRVFRKKNNIKFNSDGFLIDEPINTRDMDILGRKVNAKDAVDKLLKTDTSNSAFTFGVIGQWGIGKSSFIKMMKEYIDNKNDSSLITMEFNPWIYRKNSNLTHVFFDELSDKLSLYNVGISRDIRQYSKTLTSVDNNWAKFISNLLLIFSHKSERVMHYELTNDIKELDKKIIVFIDDIDRLNSNEMDEIFRLVRNISNFPYMYFVLAFDKEYVTETLMNLYLNYNSLYTEKIIQEEYVLPVLTHDQIQKQLLSTIRDHFGNDEMNQFKQFLDKNNHEFKIFTYLRNIREVKRFINILNLCYTKMKEDILFLDLALYELLRMRYPYVLKIIEEKDEEIFDVNEEGRIELYNKDIDSNESANKIFSYYDKIDLNDYINNNLNELKLCNNDVLNLKKILYMLWGKHKELIPLSINYKPYYKRYFYHSLLESDISESQITEILSLPFDDAKQLLKYYAENKSYYLVKRINDISSKTIINVRNTLRIMFYFNAVSKSHLFNINDITDNIHRLQIEENQSVMYQNKEKDFIFQQLNHQDNIEFSIDFIRDIIWNYSLHSPFPFTIDELLDIQQNIFIDLASKNENNIKKIIKQWYLLLPNRKLMEKHYSDYMNAKERKYNVCMKEIAEKNIEKFLPFTITQGFSKDEYTVKQYMYLNLWGSEDNYFNYVMKLDNKSTVIKEYQEFLKKVKNNQGNYIPFYFKKIDISILSN